MTIPSPPAPRIFKPGDVFRDHYVVQGFLGEGGSGQVYDVEHRHSGRRCALKVLHIANSASASKIARTLATAKATFNIRHRNVVDVHDFACDDGMVWMLQELLEGWTVAQLLDRYGAFSPITAIDLVIEVAWGLQAAHDSQIVHRDVKPSNVFVTRLGQVKVIDFELAKLRLLDLASTLDDCARGTAAYMGPDQLYKAPATPQMDVFGLGTMLWELLAGRLPFEGPQTMMEEVRRQLWEEPESLVTVAGLPAYCDDALRGAMAKDPARRYRDMWTMAQALRDLRARFLADPAMALRVQHPPPWERSLRIAQDPGSFQQYRPPTSLPRDSPAPDLPSRRIVVSPAVTADPVARAPAVATTVPMARVVTVPMPVMENAGPRSLADPAAPTVRGLPARRRQWIRALAVVAAGLGVLGAGVWLLAAYDLLPVATSSAAGSSPGKGPAPAPRPKR